MREDAKFFIESIRESQKFMDCTYPDGITPEEFRVEREKQLAEIREVIRRNDRFLEDFFSPMEEKDRLTDEEKEELNEFAKGLNTGISASDDGILLRLYTILYRDAMRGENLNEQVKYIYYRNYYEYAVNRMSALFPDFRGFEEICDFADLYDLLTLEGKSFFMRCWCNRLLLSGYTWQEKREVLDFVREKQEEEPDNGLPYAAYFLAMYRNIKNLYNEILNDDAHGIPNDPGALELACESSDYIYDHMMHMKNNPRANRMNSLLAYNMGKFYTGKLTLDELLEEFRALGEIHGDYNLLEKSTVYFKVSLAIAQFKRIYDKNATYNEIYNLFRVGMEDAVDFMRSLKPSEINSSIATEYSGYLEKMADFLRYDQVQPYYEEALKARSRALYVHSMTVSRLSVSICRSLFREMPEYFVGLSGCNSLEDVKAGETDILNTVYNMAVFHDIGMTRQTDLRDICHRSLSPLEKEVLRSHPLTGVFRSENTFPPEILEAIRSHHIAYDGSGYPENSVPGRNAPLLHILYYANALEDATNTLDLMDHGSVSADEFIRSALGLAGKEYAPEVAQLVSEDEGLRKEIDEILNHQRIELCWKVYAG